jgi:5'-nucleotidase
MRILVVNDDGINAPGLKIAQDIAREIGGEDVELWTIAPEAQKSGVGHAISYAHPYQAVEIAPRTILVFGMPADCVMFALHVAMKNSPPDLILSGVNEGHNFAQDVLYSGTVGGAIEGALQGIKSIALSQNYLKEEYGSSRMWDGVRTWGVEAVKAALKARWRKDVFYNINFPICSDKEGRGIKFCAQGYRTIGGLKVMPCESPPGRQHYWAYQETDNLSAEPDTDCYLVTEGWVSITPMHTNLTAYDCLEGTE